MFTIFICNSFVLLLEQELEQIREENRTIKNELEALQNKIQVIKCFCFLIQLVVHINIQFKAHEFQIDLPPMWICGK